MQNKVLIWVVMGVIIVGVGAGYVVSHRGNSKPKSVSQNNSAAPSTEKMMADKTESTDVMMSDDKVLGVVVKNGELYTVWPDNELADITHDITLKDGTKVSASGNITKADGTKITLKEGEMLSTIGIMSMVDVSKMMEMKEDGMKKEGSMGDQEKDKAEMSDKSDTSMTHEDAMMKSGSYKDYSVDTVAAEQKAGHKVVLFFHANWCPFCQAADKAFKENASSIPAGVTVLKTDYDSQTALKSKYGVTHQHTFVQIDNNGNAVSTWVSGDIANLKANVK